MKMADETEKLNFSLNSGCFKSLNDAQKDTIMKKTNAITTNNATRLWIDCFRDYLAQKDLPEIEEISNDQLANVL